MSRLIRKDPDAGKDWGQEEKGMTEDEMVGWHHRLNGHEFEQPRGDGEGQGSLACCRSESDTTDWLDNNCTKNHPAAPGENRGQRWEDQLASTCCDTEISQDHRKKNLVSYYQTCALHRNSILNNKNFKDTDSMYKKPEFRSSVGTHGNCVGPLPRTHGKLLK